MQKRTRVRYRRPPDRRGHEGYDRVVDQKYDERKFTELLVLVADRLRTDEAGGATKLNKVLYFADFTHFRRTGRSITGAEYQKLTNGPAPRRLLPVRADLIDRAEAELEDHDFVGYTQHRLVPKRSADVTVFAADELESIYDVLDDLAGMSGREVSDLSHEEAGWRLTEEGDTIPYAAALIPREQPLTPTAKELATAVAERYGIPTEA